MPSPRLFSTPPTEPPGVESAHAVSAFRIEKRDGSLDPPGAIGGPLIDDGAVGIAARRDRSACAMRKIGAATSTTEIHRHLVTVLYGSGGDGSGF